MGEKALVALDTDHIKQYVFPTSKLKEIRGASSLLDRLNREKMERIAGQLDPRSVKVYANGGSGLFVIAQEKAEEFCEKVKAAYLQHTKRGASITCAIQPLPTQIPDDEDGILDADIPEALALIRYHLQAAKLCPPTIIALPSHPFMRICESCGVRYAESFDESPDTWRPRWEPDQDERDRRFCTSCQEKRVEDRKIKNFIKGKKYLEAPPMVDDERVKKPLWERILDLLRGGEKGAAKTYEIPPETERPNDFNDFRLFPGPKDYMGLIYADGNGMGAKTEEFTRLRQWKNFANTVDHAIDVAVSDAIKTWLPVHDPKGPTPLFPFDLLLLGGDDVMMVTPAPVALNVARTIAVRFFEEANRAEIDKEKAQASEHSSQKHTLSIGVVLAPVSYPFGMLRDLAESTLKYAKKEGAKRLSRTTQATRTTEATTSSNQAPATRTTEYGDTFINFLVVAGSTSQDFGKVYDGLREKHGRVPGENGEVEFRATLRPYTVEELDAMLGLIREGKKKGLGRTKLHQVREAVLRLNLTSSVIEGLSVLRNWETPQKNFVLKQIYTLAQLYQEPDQDNKHPAKIFPRVTFPWFADGPATYRTSLLDFVELYDFVDEKNQPAQEGADHAHAH